MRTSRLLVHGHWLAVLLSSCGDDGAVVEETSSDSSTSAGADTHAEADTSAAADTSGPADSTSVADSEGSGGTNAAPEANDDVVYGVQNQTLSVDAPGLLANDADPDADALTVIAAGPATAQGGSVTVGVGGDVSYEPVAGFWGPDTFEYTISDGGAETSATVTVYVAPVFIPMSSVASGLGGFALDGEAVDDRSGSSVSDAGDVDGDGLADVIVGALLADSGGEFSGRSYVVLGTTEPSSLELGAVARGNGGFAIDGESPGERSGRSVSGAGDVNADGFADVIVGADYASPHAYRSGRAYVVFGKPDMDTVDLDDIALGDGGFAIDGVEQNDYAATSVSGAGDINGDGLSDLIVGAPGAPDDGMPTGRTYVVFGRTDTAPVDLADLATNEGGFVIEGEADNDLSGGSVSDAGDVNGDGLADVLVGALNAGLLDAHTGRSYVVFGKADTATVALAAIATGNGGFVLDGETYGDRVGDSASGAGDVDGDGLADLIVGAPYAEPNGFASGRSYVVFGKVDTAGVVLADVVLGDGGFAIDGAESEHFSGASVSGAGDVNGDGLADVIVGAPGVGFYDGRTYVVYGKIDTALVELAEVDLGDGGFALDAENDLDSLGSSVSGAGDVDGDGFADLLIGAPSADPGGSASGRSYVVFGVPTDPG